MRSFSCFLAVAAAAAFWTVPEPAAAQTPVETLVCESRNNGHTECRYSARGLVTVNIRRQLSSTRCVFDQNWGTFDGGVWVDYGCRAEFVVNRPPNANPRPVGGTHQTLVCESMDRRRQNCSVPDIDPRSVALERRLSGTPCIEGRNWGATEEGIWVTEGCRATFAYTTRGLSFNPYGGTPHDFETECESLRGEWVHCAVDQVHQARVQLIASNDACHAYKAWGVDDTGIWVRSNCQGAFRIQYRHE